MDAYGEIGVMDSKRSSEVVVVIAGGEKKNAASKAGVDAPGSCPSPEIARLVSSPNKPAKISTAVGLSQRKFMSRKGSLHSKSKSRFGEQSLPFDPNMFDDISLSKLEKLRETSNSPFRNTSIRSSSYNKVTSKEETPKTLLMTPSSQGVGAEDEEICKKVSIGKELKYKRVKMKTLSGPPLLGRINTASQLSVRQKQKKGKGKQVIDINKLHEMKRESFCLDHEDVGLSTISNALEESDDGEGEEKDKEITSEMEAHAAAIDIFRNIVQPNCNSDIDEKALRRFMPQEEVDLVLPLIDVAEKGRIEKTYLIAWVVYKERKALAHTLNDTKTAVKQLNKLVSGILIIVIVMVWLLLMEIATTKVLVLLSSQLVVAAFMFKNTCNTIFKAIVFVFVMHPFDVGDCCVVDGTQMIVEEMNILTTVFLKFDNEKINYPNSVLATKPICNFYRSPEMGDSLEFSIDFMTPVEKIGTLKETIKKYLVENAHHWQPNHNVVVKEIENVNKIKMALFFNHTMNFQDFAEKMRRRSELVIEMKRIFHVLEIKYNLLPQDVNLVKSTVPPRSRLHQCLNRLPLPPPPQQSITIARRRHHPGESPE
ncbi:hypothetical protein RJ640_001875, partial [Escallonia rubra]